MSELSDRIEVMRSIAINENGAGMDKVLQDIYRVIDENEDLLKEAYELDRAYSKRKEIFKIKLILDDIEEIINYKFNESKMFENIDEKRVLNVKQNLGVIGVFYDGDILITLDIICKVLRTNNAVIFNVDVAKNVGTNNLIINLVKEVLKRNDKSELLVDINFADSDNLLLENLDAIIVCGVKEKRNGFRNMCRCKMIESGFGCNEIYIEDANNEAFIKEIIEKEDMKIRFYIKDGIDIGIDGIHVKDVNHAIRLINEVGSEYSSAIFTSDEKNAREFVRKIKSRYAFVNTSPTLARISDISIEDLYYEKCCIV